MTNYFFIFHKLTGVRLEQPCNMNFNAQLFLFFVYGKARALTIHSHVSDVPNISCNKLVLIIRMCTEY